MQISRLIETSFHYLLQEKLSRYRYKEKPKTSNFKDFNLKYNNVVISSDIVVYKNNTEVNSSDYKINYVNGIVSFEEPVKSSDIIEVSYGYCPINIYEEGSSILEENLKFPAIAIYEDEREDVGYELGSNKKQKRPTWVFEVWAERGGERSDITDMIMEIFEESSFPIIDYNIAFPINEDGTKNDSFDAESQIAGFMFVDSIYYNKGGSLDIGDKPKFISEITIELVVNT